MKAENKVADIVAIVGAGLEVLLVVEGLIKPIVLWVTWIVVADIDLLFHAYDSYKKNNKLGFIMYLISAIFCTIIGIILA